jgi:uncharacterized protein with HEPN domain
MKNQSRRNIERLRHILDAINQINEFTEALSELEFIKNALINNAVLYQFTIIGEAIVHVDDKILEKYDYPWYKVRAFRNLIAHEYFGIQLSAVWAVVQHDLAELKTMVCIMIEKEF